MKPEDPIAKLEKILNDFNMIGMNGITTHGSLHKGYAIHTPPTTGGLGGTGFPTPILPPPVVLTGACCDEEGDCTIVIEEECEGEFQGIGTTCDPNPCEEPTGACCVGDGVCTITTEEECVGEYQGDDTTCDPNPCMVDCSCGFSAFDESGRLFLTQTWSASGNFHWEDDDAICGETHCDLTFEFTQTKTYDPNTCEISTDCTGSYTFDAVTFGSPPQHEEGDWCTDPSAGGCGICAGNCPLPAPPSSGFPSCSDPDCSCSATEINCSYSDGTSGACNCGAGRPPTVEGTCDVTQTVTLSNECNPI